MQLLILKLVMPNSDTSHLSTSHTLRGVAVNRHTHYTPRRSLEEWECVCVEAAKFEWISVENTGFADLAFVVDHREN